MVTQLQELLAHSANTTPSAVALIYQDQALTYADLYCQVRILAVELRVRFGLKKGDRVAIYLEKRFETVIAFFATLEAGAVCVPINPLLKTAQVAHVLRDSGAAALVTSGARLQIIQSALEEVPALQGVLLVDSGRTEQTQECLQGSCIDRTALLWENLIASPAQEGGCVKGEADDLAAILYTSGSTGLPKGVMLSHRNMVAGAVSVSQYLKNRAQDRLLAVLPFSFDYGLSQLTTAFRVGATVVLINHLFPGDVIRTLEKYEITGLAAVPPLWVQLAGLDWPEKVQASLRYITNSGGAMSAALLERLRAALPKTDIFLMYGLTEAFRSTYLDPSWLDRKPGSIGKAVPHAEVLVINSQNQVCAPYEKGELVHRGELVAQGYWQDEARTRERFRPLPPGLGNPPDEIAVWSGDTVYQDEEGFLYFVGREDEMIKCSGYRVSPGEIETLLETSGQVRESVVFGVPDSQLGQKIVLVCEVARPENVDKENVGKEIMGFCRRELPAFMVPAVIEIVDTIPRNPNGKLDRSHLRQQWIESNERPHERT